ncbi:site-specific DNA-methyltransferase [Salinarimonas rosea]|uniref:site-specific DNA-methyltransferase n=1 Tax=Salinarimonas rosea TaxID=552063 RepID=UPI001FD9756E|nr:site-specific DNA-methyltransferase [Salinarimonas rosea]
MVEAPPLYIQEKIHPKAIIQDLMRRSSAGAQAKTDAPDLFADFNGLPDPEARLEFYQHEQHWTNRMILGDSLQAMASLAQREALKGKVQAIYFDPPYGIKFNSNWQVSTLSRDVKDGKATDITREPEQVKAFRDTWKDGIHSYLTYLRDRLTVARELLTESGSIFVQIGDENVHRVRAVMDEVFGEENFICSIAVQKTGSQSGNFLQSTSDDVLWYSRSKVASQAKFRPLFFLRDGSATTGTTIERTDFSAYPLTSDGIRTTTTCDVFIHAKRFHPGNAAHWKILPEGLKRAERAGRIALQKTQIRLKYFFDDYPVQRLGDYWDDVGGATGKVYIVQTSPKVVERCLLMATDPGDLVLDPTCGSGTTAFVAEQWGRRWITIDTSRVALALARARIMGARYPYYLLADSPEGRRKEAEVSGRVLPEHGTRGDVRQGFVYERAPHVTLKSIANNAEIDVIHERFQPQVEAALAALNAALAGHPEPFPIASGGREGKKITFGAPGLHKLPSGEDAPAGALLEWEVPREAPSDWPHAAADALERFWTVRIARQGEIDAAIARAADVELLYDRPYEDKGRVRVAGPCTVESLSPHRVVPADDLDDELIDELDAGTGKRIKQTGGTPPTEFATMVIEHLRTAGVHQHAKSDTIRFTSLQGWPGEWIGAAGTFAEGAAERRAAIFIGPEFGTVTRAAIVAAAREATDARFDVLIVCAFAFDAHAAEVQRMGPMPVLQARMNPDLHMAEDLKNTGKGNLFVVFGEPDVEVEDAGEGLIRVRVHGVDVFDPNTGQIRSDGVEGVAAWFVDDDYNEESFFVRQAYFLGAQDPYKALKSALKSEIDADAWETLYSPVSRAFRRPSTGRIAVKVINHFGDEVMKVFGV